MFGKKVIGLKFYFKKFILIRGGGWSFFEKELGFILGNRREDMYMYLSYIEGGYLFEVVGEGWVIGFWFDLLRSDINIGGW